MEMKHILFDSDTGVDDALALLFALRRKDVKLEGVVSIFGNINEKQAAQNILDIIALANPGYEIPVVVGSHQTLNGKVKSEGVPHIHGKNGIGNVELPKSEQKVLEMDGADFIIKKAKELDGELIIVAVGPLTNLALALKKEPNLPKYVKKVVIMGGTVLAPGNVTPVAEANIHSDPEAADYVFQAGFNLTVVGLDVTMKCRIKYDQILYMDRHATEENKKLTTFLKEMLPLYMNFYHTANYFQDACAMHDPLAMLVAVNPSVVTTQKFKARVECADCMCNGMIVTDRRMNTMEDAKYVEFCMDVDTEAAVNEVLGAIS